MEYSHHSSISPQSVMNILKNSFRPWFGNRYFCQFINKMEIFIFCFVLKISYKFYN